jgi:hypothetical protein
MDKKLQTYFLVIILSLLSVGYSYPFDREVSENQETQESASGFGKLQMLSAAPVILNPFVKCSFPLPEYSQNTLNITIHAHWYSEYSSDDLNPLFYFRLFLNCIAPKGP